MKLDKLCNKQDEYMTPRYAIKPLLNYLDGFKTIWCPFDTSESRYVELLSTNHKVIHSHISDGADFFKVSPPDCDCIVSNPPYSCLTPEHQVLTKDGWKYIGDIGIGDDVLSLNYTTLEVSWDSVVNTVNKFVTEYVYEFKSRDISLRTTHDHRMFAYNSYKDKLTLNKYNDLIYAEDINEYSYIPKYGYKWNGYSEKYITIPEIMINNGRNTHKKIEAKKILVTDFAKFMGLWLADGYVRGSKGGLLNNQGNIKYTVGIKQGIEGYEFVRDVLSKLPFKYHEYHNKNNTCNFEIHSKQLWEILKEFGNSYDKYIPKYIKNGNKEVINAFMCGYTFGDSYSTNHNGTDYTVYSTVSRKLAEDLQEIMLKCGILCNISRNKTIKGNQIYLLRVNKTIKRKRMFYKNKERVFYSGMVYCITLNKNSVFLTKRDEKVCFTGNCKTQVFERLFELNKPFAMLVGVVGLFESQARFNMFKDNKFELMYFNKRVSYLRSYQDEKPALNPPFSSVYVCHNILPKQIVFEVIDKGDL